MLALFACMFAAGFAALALVDDSVDTPAEDEATATPPESSPETEPLPEPEPDAEPAPLFTLQTDPVTGDTDITVAPEEDGRLMAFLETGELNRFTNGSCVAEYFGLTLVLVPEDVDFEAAANSFDWQAFRDANIAAGITPDRADFFCRHRRPAYTAMGPLRTKLLRALRNSCRR